MAEVLEEDSFAELMKYLGKGVKEVLPPELLRSEDTQEASAPSAPKEMPTELGCWGALLRGDATPCTSNFVIGKGHFKNKFCQVCRQNGVELPATRLKVVSAACPMRNELRQGFWNVAADVGLYRVINQTAECQGQPLLVTADALAHTDHLRPLPPNLIGDDGRVRLMVSKGTLVPAGRSQPATKSLAQVAPQQVPSEIGDQPPRTQGEARLSPSSGGAAHGLPPTSAPGVAPVALSPVAAHLSTVGSSQTVVPMAQPIDHPQQGGGAEPFAAAPRGHGAVKRPFSATMSVAMHDQLVGALQSAGVPRREGASLDDSATPPGGSGGSDTPLGSTSPPASVGSEAGSIWELHTSSQGGASERCDAGINLAGPPISSRASQLGGGSAFTPVGAPVGAPSDGLDELYETVCRANELVTRMLMQPSALKAPQRVELLTLRAHYAWQLQQLNAMRVTVRVPQANAWQASPAPAPAPLSVSAPFSSAPACMSAAALGHAMGVHSMAHLQGHSYPAALQAAQTALPAIPTAHSLAQPLPNATLPNPIQNGILNLGSGDHVCAGLPNGLGTAPALGATTPYLEPHHIERHDQRANTNLAMAGYQAALSAQWMAAASRATAVPVSTSLTSASLPLNRHGNASMAMSQADSFLAGQALIAAQNAPRLPSAAPPSLPPSPPSSGIAAANSRPGHRSVQRPRDRIDLSNRTNVSGLAVLSTLLIQNHICATRSGSLPGNIGTAFVALIIVVWLMPASSRQRKQLVSTLWSMAMICVPLFFIIDDLSRSPDELATRMSTIPSIAHFSIGVHLVVGFVHGVMPLSLGRRKVLLASECALWAFRCVYLASMTQQLYLPVLGVMLALIPSVAAFFVSSRRHEMWFVALIA